MAEEIIDIRDRIEQMRIQIENDATEQVSSGKPLEIHQNHPSSNISLSFLSIFSKAICIDLKTKL